MHHVAGMFFCGQYRFSENDGQEWISFLESKKFFKVDMGHVHVKTSLIAISN